MCVHLDFDSPASQPRCRLLQQWPSEPGRGRSTQGGGQGQEAWDVGAGSRAEPSNPPRSLPFPPAVLKQSATHQPLSCSTSSSKVTELLLLGGQVQWEGGLSSDVQSSSSITSVPKTKAGSCTRNWRRKVLLAAPSSTSPDGPCTLFPMCSNPRQRVQHPACSICPTNTVSIGSFRGDFREAAARALGRLQTRNTQCVIRTGRESN